MHFSLVRSFLHDTSTFAFLLTPLTLLPKTTKSIFKRDIFKPKKAVFYDLNSCKKRDSRIFFLQSKQKRKKPNLFSKKPLTFSGNSAIILQAFQRKHLHLGVAQLVARYLGVVEAASSSLVTQTKWVTFQLPIFLYIIRFSAILAIFQNAQIWALLRR